ncbi:peptidoglycan/LPS O-acetylase OafA/YrhL [Azospirillum lipoferum]|uniref:Acyltransferase n=1 Tax=Azospirillum lipoferum TaxID=193 RepID=A0A5A9GW29_AZOLI|nr:MULTISPECIES: acyltransferase [Azospirillum]KAA0598646.1 acyltransferase [Azospirillum lipoferum]MCP1609333.1 peptidoglycan/LPS O-acetylase OafA/YrhL [Azospirillum lipoferum]MDW5535357.1 acyltransferase [Azospirillum sp. NL1]
MRKNMLPYHVVELRGLACILLVAYHVVGIPGSGMQVAEGSIYRYATDSFELIRMPLFTFISGLVYALNPARADRLTTFFIKKLRRLGFPFLVVSALFYFLQTHAPGANGSFVPESMWRIYVFPYAHFWYLQALFLIFAAVALLDVLHAMDRPGGFALAMAAAVAACLTVHADSNVLSINEACFLLPHFLFGVGVTRFRAMVPRQTMLAAAGAALAIGVVLHQASLWGYLPHFGWNSGVALLCGMGGAVTLLHAMPSSWVFRIVGASSYAIYLHHALFAAGARVVLHRIEAPDGVIFWVALLSGLIGPMVLEAMAQIRPWTRVALMGKA